MNLQAGYRATVDDIDEAGWNRICDMFDDATMYCTWAYGAVRWGEDSMSHLVLTCDDEIVAAAQLRLVTVPVIGTGIAYLRWGPLWQRAGQEPDPVHLKQVLIALHEEYVQKRGLYLRVIPHIAGADSEIMDLFADLTYQYNPEGVTHRTLRVPLSEEAATIRKNLKSKWRGHLNKSERQGLTISDGTDLARWDRFYDIYRDMQGRKGFDERVDVLEYRAVQERLPEELKLVVSLAEHEGRTVAGLVWSAIGNAGIAIFSGTRSDAMKLNASYLLRWHLVNELKQRGCRILDQGGVDPDANPGSYKFKIGMGGEDVRFIGEFNAWQGMLSRSVIQAAERARGLSATVRRAMGRG